jgi:Uma2 family endonuclease
MSALAQKAPAASASGLWTADQFLDFSLTRPEGERWQLIDGLAIMMVPPSYVHQRIVGNLEELLRSCLKAVRPEWYAYGNVGLRIDSVTDFHPQPDVVIAPASASTEYYRDDFAFVA